MRGRAGAPPSGCGAGRSGVRARRSGESSAIARDCRRVTIPASMRVLALADQRPPMDPALMARRLHVDAVVCLGDLDRGWIESLRELRIPRVGVHGNHDPPELLQELEVEDLQTRRTRLGPYTAVGFEGCVKYGRGGPHQYTQRQASRLARKLPAAEIVIC